MKLPPHLAEFFRALARPYPSRDWLIALIALFFLFLALAFYGVYLYFGVETGSLLGSTNANPASVIKVTKADIQNVVAAYNARIVNWNAHNISAPNVADPYAPAK